MLEERDRRLRVLSWKFPLQTMKLERMGELSDGDRGQYRSVYYLSIRVFGCWPGSVDNRIQLLATDQIMFHKLVFW